MGKKEVFKRMPGLQKVEDGEEIPIEEPEYIGVLFEFDRKTGGIYIKISDDKQVEWKIERTEKVIENCNFDIDKYGSIIGIEILNAGKWIRQYISKEKLW